MRPYVICHMCTTIDGKILVGRWPKLPAVGSGAKLFERTAASFGIDAWVNGGAGVAAIFDVPGKIPRRAAAALRLLESRRLPGGVNWLRYRVLARP